MPDAYKQVPDAYKHIFTYLISPLLNNLPLQVLKMGEKTLIDPLSLRDVIPTGKEAKFEVHLK